VKGFPAWIFARCVLTAVLLVSAGAEAAGPAGFVLYEATAATVNGEVIFLSDLDREVCFRVCGAIPGDRAERMSLAEAREELIADTLVRQEGEKMTLGSVDNTVLQETAARASEIMASCSSPCAATVTAEQVRSYAERKLRVREILKNRISVFVDVNEEEVEREFERRASRGRMSSGEVSREAVRRELLDEKTAREIRNWLDRATSKSRIVLSPLEEK